MDPVAFAAVVSSALGVIGLLRRGSTPVTPAGQAVTRAGLRAAAPVLHQAQHLPWPFRPVTSSAVMVSAAAVTSPAALVVDGASTIVEAMAHANQVAHQVGSSMLGQTRSSSGPSPATGDAPRGATRSASSRDPSAGPRASGSQSSGGAKRGEPRSRAKKRAATEATTRSASSPTRKQ